jgi:hypothetical protein
MINRQGLARLLAARYAYFFGGSRYGEKNLNDDKKFFNPVQTRC